MHGRRFLDLSEEHLPKDSASGGQQEAPFSVCAVCAHIEAHRGEPAQGGPAAINGLSCALAGIFWTPNTGGSCVVQKRANGNDLCVRVVKKGKIDTEIAI